MFSAADLIEALRKRARRSLRPERPPGEFPPGWQAWFAADRRAPRRDHRCDRDAIVAIFLQRELASPPRRVGRTQSLAGLRDAVAPAMAAAGRRRSARARIAAYAITFVVHLLLLLILLWLASVRIVGTSAPQGEEVVQVEYIGTGTPEDTGGGPPSGDRQPPAAARHASRRDSAPASASASPATAAVATPPPASDTRNRACSRGSPRRRAAVAGHAGSRARYARSCCHRRLRRWSISRGQVAGTPQLQSPTRAVEIVETQPPVQALKPQLPQVAITVPQLQQQAPKCLTEATSRCRRCRRRHCRSAADPGRAAQTPAAVRCASFRMPAPSATAAPPTPARARSDRDTAPPGNAPQRGARGESGGTPAPRSGTAAGGDGVRQRQGTGRQAGRMADAAARRRLGRIDPQSPRRQYRQASRACSTPMAVRVCRRARPTAGRRLATGHDRTGRSPDLDRAGTWLKRAPNDFTPTRFDKYWVPNETLLERVGAQEHPRVSASRSPARRRSCTAWCRCCSSAAAAASPIPTCRTRKRSRGRRRTSRSSRICRKTRTACANRRQAALK